MKTYPCRHTMYEYQCAKCACVTASFPPPPVFVPFHQPAWSVANVSAS